MELWDRGGEWGGNLEKVEDGKTVLRLCCMREELKKENGDLVH